MCSNGFSLSNTFKQQEFKHINGEGNSGVHGCVFVSCPPPSAPNIYKEERIVKNLDRGKSQKWHYGYVTSQLECNKLTATNWIATGKGRGGNDES